MGTFANFGIGLREVIWLGKAERTVKSYDPERLTEIRSAKTDARIHLRAARCCVHPTPALEELRRAASQVVRAAALAEVPLDAPVLEPIPTDFRVAEAHRDRLDGWVHASLRKIEGRTPVEVLGTRYGRLAALVLLVAAIGWPYARDAFFVHNVARGMPVTSSGLKAGTLEGAVDGHTRGPFDTHTSDAAHPFIAVDLGHVRLVRRVRVVNRGDGWFGDILPLSLEVSEDGERFHEVAVRTEQFDTWDVPLERVPARYVRITKAGGYIAINELEVYAR